MVIRSIRFYHETKYSTSSSLGMAKSILSLVWPTLWFLQVTCFTFRLPAHTPAALQTKLSSINNAQLYYYVGSGPFHKAGIMLYNPKSKQTIIRRSFTQLESSDPIIPSLPVSVSEFNSYDHYSTCSHTYSLCDNTFIKNKSSNSTTWSSLPTPFTISPPSSSRSYCYFSYGSSNHISSAGVIEPHITAT